MHTKLCFLFTLITIVLVGCNTDEDKPNQPTANGIKGNVQKGPFIAESTVIVQLLDENFISTGDIYNTMTNNDFGGFIIENEIQAPYVEIITDGFYFDEVNGYISDAKMTLRSLSKVSNTGTAEMNINLLTTLSKDRIIHLVKNEGLKYEEAKKQAQNEILTIFNLPQNDNINFNQLNISQEGEENAILLAISSILQGDLKVNRLSEMIAGFIKDIKEDGILDNDHIRNTLIKNAEFIKLSSIRFNLETRYNSLNYDATIPPFEKYAKRLLPLNVIQISPENGTNFAYGLDQLQIFFNKAVDTTTITPENIIVKNSSGQKLPGQLIYDEELFSLTFNPTGEMLNDETYTVYLSGIKALDKEIIEDYSYSFKTYPLELERGLKAYYPFSGNAEDTTDNKAHATAYNGNYVADINGMENQAYYLQGRGSYIEIPNVVDLSKSNWSYSIWVNYLSLDQDVHSLLFGLSSSCDAFGTIPFSIQNTERTSGGDLREIVIADENQRITVPVQGELINTWNLFTVAVTNNRCQIYQNGVLLLDMPETVEFLAYSQPYYISQSPYMEIGDQSKNRPLVYLDAIIDNVRIYDRALNKKEVFELYQTGN